MHNLLQNKNLIGSEINWLQALRDEGYANFAFPRAKDEYWKYTKLMDLNVSDYVVLPPFCKGKQKTQLPFEAFLIYFENGIFCPAYSNLPSGVNVVPLIEAIILNPDLKDKLGQLAEMQNNPFVALNNTYLQEGVYINIEKNIQLKKPIAIINHTDNGGENIFYNIRNLVVLEEGAEAQLLECSCYEGELKSRYFGNYVNEIYVSNRAKLWHYKLQNDAFKANHIAISFVNVGRDAKYANCCLQLGANVARNETKIKLAHSGACAEVYGIYKMSGWALIDNTVHIAHLAPNTNSTQIIKGVVDGEARGVFQGKISIEKNCDNVNGNQLHRAILLSDTAEVDCKPELEIFNDDVKCSHGAATGQLDEEQLFYMKSRGIPENEAKKILIDAFLLEVFDKIENEDIKEWFLSYLL